jgi:hypothetical protein
MSSNLDNTVARPFPDENPFAYGERTVLQLREQPFQVQDELGTVVTMPIDTNVRIPLAAAPPPSPLETVFAEEDPIARMERKLDSALLMIEKLQHRIESLDLTLARVLSR